MTNTRTAVDGLQADIEELRSSNVWLSVAPVIPAAFALYVFAARLPDPATATLPGRHFAAADAGCLVAGA